MRNLNSRFLAGRDLALKTTEEALLDEEIEEKLVLAKANPRKVEYSSPSLDFEIVSAEFDQGL